ncbi:MAG TPA: Holliday junction branch migration protein RuvA [Candidatus Margulisiibacteriota bacterium]|nr:Holliday junction branch migration protein RuvA [Candidatus Margulisiibacteriota bacterium]
MIAQLAGSLAYKSPEQLVVDVQGVGYRVLVSLNSFYRLPELGDPVRLLIHTHVREDALQLYGFIDRQEKDLFLLLNSVSGIGPRLALNILSGTPTTELLDALEAGDLVRLVAIPGVGKKTAERLVLELRDKIKLIKGARDAGDARQATGLESEAVSALVNLGYRQNEAERAVKAARAAGASDLEAVIRTALKRVTG